MRKYVTTVSLGIIQAFFLFILFGAGVDEGNETCTDGAIDLIRNGYCNLENNNERCQYDGGDCCSCSCVYGLMFSCGTSGFSCLDPDFADMEPYICEELSPLISSCPAELQREWIVDNTTQARALAEAVRCPGESFNVTWKGKVIVDETILIFDGTFLNVTSGDGDTSIIDGDGKTRLFAVVNASLYLSNITLNRGNADYGGAISASRSRLTFRQVALTGNIALNGGGAVWLSNSILTFFGEETSLVNNTALDGGALYVTGGSNASWTGNTNFSQNTGAASGNGGALCVTNGSNVIWTATSHFVNNSALFGGGLYVSDDSSAAWTAASQFVNNIANTGGALYVADGSSAVWDASSYFLENSAEDGGGGALYMADGSSVSWNAVSQFVANSASYGGALYMDGGSKAIWTSTSTFLANSAYNGGAVYIWLGSSAVWTAESHLLSNSAVSHGGALYLMYNSNVSWAANTTFSKNAAKGGNGGALYLEDSTAIWDSESQFISNTAKSKGGALSVKSGSNVLWSSETVFSKNVASSKSGGALYLEDSTAIWASESQFISNTAESEGGAISVRSGSKVLWAGETVFSKNVASSRSGGALCVANGSSAVWTGSSQFLANFASSHGGAVYVVYNSTAAWKAQSRFSANIAQFDGGAVYSSNSGYLLWSSNAQFVNNTAQNGGALFVTYGVNVKLGEETNFTSNSALLNGGAVGSSALDSEVSDEESIIDIKGTTSFTNNTCGAHGGGLAMVQSLTVLFDSNNTTFLQNTADVSGGAVFIVGIVIGPVFRNVIFVENYAQTGGGVHATGSGTTVTLDGDEGQVENPTTFDGCIFIGNFAFATGGAVDSASGQDIFVRTLFEGNVARAGGALRLGGMTSIDDCVFDENISELGEGPTVSNVGYLSTFTNSVFQDNSFDCEPQTFLDFNESDDLFGTVCNGCPETCIGCSFGDTRGSPTCTSLSEAGVEHATSNGGPIEDLRIHKGYWRATNTSVNIFKCFNTNACAGGLTGASDYCLLGYEGPYCSVCSKNYVSSLSYTCRECSSHAVGISVAVAIIVLAAAVGFIIASYMLSTEVIGTGRGIVDRVTRRVPMHSVKIVIIVWQILTQFASVANVTFPNVYHKLLDVLDVFNFDLTWVVSTGCFLEVDFHDRLMWTTIAPVVALASLGGTYFAAVGKIHGSRQTALQNTRHKHVSMALLITFLVYSSVSSVVFQMFACEHLDDGKRYLMADYTIDCDSTKHRVLQIYAGFMITLYPIGIPAFYACLLFRNRRVLRDDRFRQEYHAVKSTSDLWKPYKPQMFYYEIVECSRRILLTGAVVFIFPNSSSQVAVALAIAVVFVFVSEGMAPYESPWDAWISRMGHLVVFASMYLALLLKVNVSGDNFYSQNMFEVILVAAHGCMVFAVVAEAVMMALALGVESRGGDSSPRLQRSSDFCRTIRPTIADEDSGCTDDLQSNMEENRVGTVTRQLYVAPLNTLRGIIHICRERVTGQQGGVASFHDDAVQRRQPAASAEII